MPPNRRTIPAVLDEISLLRRHAHEAPPHHGGGRDVLEQRLRALEAELARLRAADRRAADVAADVVADVVAEPTARGVDGSDHDRTEPD